MGAPARALGGRPRRAGVSRAVLDAAVVLMSSHGYDGTSLDDIAQRAQAAKTTIYRRWTSKSALAIDALVQLIGEPPLVSDDVTTDVADAAHWLADRIGQAPVRRILLDLVAIAGRDDDVRASLRSALREPFAARLIDRWRLERDDVDLAFDIVVGSLLHRHAMNGKISERDADGIARMAVTIIAGER